MSSIAWRRKIPRSRAKRRAAAGFVAAPVTIDVVYGIATETHNPIQTHASVAVPDGDTLTLYETTQGVVNHRNVLADMLGLPRDKVRVVSRFGSGFGNKLFPWSQSPLLRAAALALGTPVKLVLSRPMMFHNVGHRPRTEQRMRIGATKEEARLAAARLRQRDVDPRRLRGELRRSDAAHVQRAQPARDLRARPAQHRHAHVDARTGAVPGLFALSLDVAELAIKLGIDPVQLGQDVQ